VQTVEQDIYVDGQVILALAESDPASLPWGEIGA
jgi:hypothetical protein